MRHHGDTDPVIFHLGRDPGEKFPLGKNSQDYKRALASISNIVKSRQLMNTAYKSDKIDLLQNIDRGWHQVSLSWRFVTRLWWTGHLPDVRWNFFTLFFWSQILRTILFTGTRPVPAQAGVSALQVLLATLGCSVYSELFRLQHSCTIAIFLLFCCTLIFSEIQN